ncbi:hypothetical protein CDD80_3789 [Ophiocordyceps camponoti-rufipedis]|uniref:LYR motif-containing protein Cup1-like N-terminal domain-containing protein n=1 Tax=Ophiocordyceps camponoti-rufipedis TaxID=2004952 RepID=A0A2C5ZII3_9HYPO|nr:hypothetical protein CDD80_3789 [Ophiocordyceps camponoti-rufipedis]
MPVPWSPVPASLPPLSLYRHILREVSYLPPSFRANIADAIRHRFHENRAHGPLVNTRLARGRKVLRALRAANSGDTSVMTKLVYLGFGRTGFMRRRLLSEFVKHQGPSDSKTLDALLDKGEAPKSDAQETVEHKRKPKNDFFVRWDQPKLFQLLKSQRQQQGSAKLATSWPTSPLKSIDQDQFVPEKTIWGKPPSEILLRAKRAKWWKLTAAKMLPPLGRGEWELLGQLSEGAQDSEKWAVPQRRRVAQTVQSTDEPAPWDWRAHASTTVDKIERPKSLYNQRRSGQRHKGPYELRQRKDKIPARWFRRHYIRTWLSTPNISQNANTLRYSISWGKVGSRVPTD